MCRECRKKLIACQVASLKGIQQLHEELWQQLIGLDRQKTARRAKCRYEPGSDCYVITLLNSEYAVNLKKKDNGGKRLE